MVKEWAIKSAHDTASYIPETAPSELEEVFATNELLLELCSATLRIKNLYNSLLQQKRLQQYNRNHDSVAKYVLRGIDENAMWRAENNIKITWRFEVVIKT